MTTPEEVICWPFSAEPLPPPPPQPMLVHAMRTIPKHMSDQMRTIAVLFDLTRRIGRRRNGTRIHAEAVLDTVSVNTTVI